jgi:uncharacterized membrane protein YczE
MPRSESNVVMIPSARELVRRGPKLLVGLVGLGVGLALMVESGLGLAPWDVLHEGLASRLGVEIGTVVVGLGVVVLALWIPLRQRPGIGTVCNAALVGVFANLSLQVLPTPSTTGMRSGFLLAGILIQGVAIGLYIGAGLGPGPRDGLMTGIAARGHPIWAVRLVLELVVLGIGFTLGGTVGIGTVLFALGIGPLAHVFLRMFRMRTEADLGPGVAGD